MKVCAITTGIRKYKSVVKKNKKKHDKIVLLEKSKLNSIEVLISKSLIDLNISNISLDEFALVNNALNEYDNMKEGKKVLKLKQFIEDYSFL